VLPRLRRVQTNLEAKDKSNEVASEQRETHSARAPAEHRTGAPQL
jgi:hypothetical protein